MYYLVLYKFIRNSIWDYLFWWEKLVYINISFTIIISVNPQAKEISDEITAGGWGGSGGGGAAPLLPQVTQSITT